MASRINTAFMKLTRRAEASVREKLVSTFVDVGPLFTLLSSHDHQIMYGRRGTGKTHALLYLAETLEQENGIPIYIDLRNIGSSGGLYADSSVPIPERATRLLIDTLASLHDALLEFVVLNSEDFDLSITGPILDRLANALTEVKVVGTIEKQETTSQNQEMQRSVGVSANLSTESGPSVQANASSQQKQGRQTQSRMTNSGTKSTRFISAQLLSRLTI